MSYNLQTIVDSYNHIDRYVRPKFPLHYYVSGWDDQWDLHHLHYILITWLYDWNDVGLRPARGDFRGLQMAAFHILKSVRSL